MEWKEQHIDQAASISWLRDFNIFTEKKAFMCAIQDQSNPRDTTEKGSWE